MDCGLWLTDRVLAFAEHRKWTPGAEKPVTYYTHLEACRFVGIGPNSLRRIIGNTKPQAVQVGASQTFNLWGEPFLHLIRKAIAEGRIWIKSSSLTRPKLGVNVCQPRHPQAEDQKAETLAWKKANPFAGVIW